MICTCNKNKIVFIIFNDFHNNASSNFTIDNIFREKDVL